jgi:rod shape-determining protein MreB
MKLGSAFPLDEELTLEIKGRDSWKAFEDDRGLDEEIREALAETVATIIEAVRALEQTPPQLSADIVDRGIVLTGGGAPQEPGQTPPRETASPCRSRTTR